MSDLTDYIYHEYKQRILSGKSTAETTAEVKTLLESDEEKMAQLWDERAGWVISSIFSTAAREERRVLMKHESVIQIPQNSGIFGERRIDVSVLQKPESLFDALIHAGDRWIRYGDMRREDWHLKAREYYISADRTMERAFAAEVIMEHIQEDKTTEQSLTEDQFRELLPPDGF